MTYKSEDVVFESTPYWVLNKKSDGFEVYKNGITHSTRCAVIGYTGEEGLSRAKAEIIRRKKLEGK